MTLLADVVGTAAVVAATRSRRAKVDALAGLIGRLDPEESAITVAALGGSPRQGKVGVGWAGADLSGRADVPTLTLRELDALLDELGSLTGAGSRTRRRLLLEELGRRATPAEADFVRRLLVGELRHGALTGVVEQAVAAAHHLPPELVRRAAMLSGDLPGIAARAVSGGRAALEAVGLEPGTAVAPMLAAGATDVADAVAATGPASVEWKLDGIRLQAHRRGDAVRLYTRNLNDVTERMPAVAAELGRLRVDAVILDGEALGEGDDAVAGWFDVLHVDGSDLIDAPLSTRLDALDALGGLRRIPSRRTDAAVEAAAMLEEALAHGHEGVVLKALDSPYTAGRRGAAWRKVKPVHTLDLVVLAVEWGSGRRRGRLSNLHLGALDATGTPVMVGKTFKGMTDELLEWQTRRFLDLETGRSGHVVEVRAEQVVEVAVDGAHVSTRYPGGVALRFARVRRYRHDKDPAEADTLDAIRALIPTSRPSLDLEPTTGRSSDARTA